MQTPNEFPLVYSGTTEVGGLKELLSALRLRQSFVEKHLGCGLSPNCRKHTPNEFSVVYSGTTEVENLKELLSAQRLRQSFVEKRLGCVLSPNCRKSSSSIYFFTLNKDLYPKKGNQLVYIVSATISMSNMYMSLNWNSVQWYCGKCLEQAMLTLKSQPCTVLYHCLFYSSFVVDLCTDKDQRSRHL